jgi:hypothetical protein
MIEMPIEVEDSSICRPKSELVRSVSKAHVLTWRLEVCYRRCRRCRRRRRRIAAILKDRRIFSMCGTNCTSSTLASGLFKLKKNFTATKFQTKPCAKVFVQFRQLGRVCETTVLVVRIFELRGHALPSCIHSLVQAVHSISGFGRAFRHTIRNLWNAHRVYVKLLVNVNFDLLQTDNDLCQFFHGVQWVTSPQTGNISLGSDYGRLCH